LSLARDTFTGGSIQSLSLDVKGEAFRSLDDLEQKVMAFIDYYYCNMAKPFKWIYQGKAFVA
jgi:hypothetical protein